MTDSPYDPPFSERAQPYQYDTGPSLIGPAVCLMVTSCLSILYSLFNIAALIFGISDTMVEGAYPEMFFGFRSGIGVLSHLLHRHPDRGTFCDVCSL